MNEKALGVFAALVAAVVTSAAPAHASVVYSYTASQTNFVDNVFPGETLKINIYLHEALTDGSASILAPNKENGLSGAGFQLKAASNSLSSASVIAGFSFNDDAPSNQFVSPVFNTVSKSPSLLQVSEVNFNANAGTGVELGNNPPLAVASGISTPSDDVFLGTLTLTVGNSLGITVFNLGTAVGDFSGSTTTNVSTYDLDRNSTSPLNAGSPAFTGVGNTVTTISVGFTPEPVSAAAFCLPGVLGLLVRRRRGESSIQN